MKTVYALVWISSLCMAAGICRGVEKGKFRVTIILTNESGQPVPFTIQVPSSEIAKQRQEGDLSQFHTVQIPSVSKTELLIRTNPGGPPMRESLRPRFDHELIRIPLGALRVTRNVAKTRASVQIGVPSEFCKGPSGVVWIAIDSGDWGLQDIHARVTNNCMADIPGYLLHGLRSIRLFRDGQPTAAAKVDFAEKMDSPVVYPRFVRFP